MDRPRGIPRENAERPASVPITGGVGASDRVESRICPAHPTCTVNSVLNRAGKWRMETGSSTCAFRSGFTEDATDVERTTRRINK